MGMQIKKKPVTNGTSQSPSSTVLPVWQRQLAPPHLTVAELKEKIQARAYGGKFAKNDLYETLPWLSKYEITILAEFHSIVQEKLFGGWATAVMKLNPDLKIDLVMEHFLFDSTKRAEFEDLMGKLGVSWDEVHAIKPGGSLQRISADTKQRFKLERDGEAVRAYSYAYVWVIEGHLAPEREKNLSLHMKWAEIRARELATLWKLACWWWTK